MFVCYLLTMNENHNHAIARDDLLFNVEMALRKAEHLWPRRLESADHDDARLELIATAVLEHLDLCGIRCVRRGPAPLHGALGPWPAARQVGGADRGDAETR